MLTEWLTVANLEENNTTQQATSNIETGDEVEQQQLVDGSSGIVITNSKSKMATTKVTIENTNKENDDDGLIADHYRRFDGEFSYHIVVFYMIVMHCQRQVDICLVSHVVLMVCLPPSSYIICRLMRKQLGLELLILKKF